MYAAAYESPSVIYTYTHVIMTKWICFLKQNPKRFNFMQIDFSSKNILKEKYPKGKYLHYRQSINRFLPVFILNVSKLD